jgi:hypothetical protein
MTANVCILIGTARRRNLGQVTRRKHGRILPLACERPGAPHISVSSSRRHSLRIIAISSTSYGFLNYLRCSMFSSTSRCQLWQLPPIRDQLPRRLLRAAPGASAESADRIASFDRYSLSDTSAFGAPIASPISGHRFMSATALQVYDEVRDLASRSGTRRSSA